MKSVDEVGKLLMNIYWTLGAAGAFVVLLGVLIVLVPHLLEVLVAIGLIGFGVSLWILAYKVHELWKKLPNFMK